MLCSLTDSKKYTSVYENCYRIMEKLNDKLNAAMGNR